MAPRTGVRVSDLTTLMGKSKHSLTHKNYKERIAKSIFWFIYIVWFLEHSNFSKWTEVNSYQPIINWWGDYFISDILSCIRRSQIRHADTVWDFSSNTDCLLCTYFELQSTGTLKVRDSILVRPLGVLVYLCLVKEWRHYSYLSERLSTGLLSNVRHAKCHFW